MLDVVFNRVGDTSPQWQDVLRNNQDLVYADWLHVDEFPASYEESADFEETSNITYDTFAFTPHMPRLNIVDLGVQAYLLEIARYRIKEYDIDARRLNVANKVDHAFWKKFRQACDDAKEDLYILGKTWHPSQGWLQGDEFRAVINYAYTDAITGCFVKQELSLERMLSEMSNQLMLYRQQTNQMQFNVLDPHDTPRLLHETEKNKKLIRQVLVFTYIQPDIPCFYYGDEIDMIGDTGPDCRRCMVWKENQQGLDLKGFVRLLIAPRKKYTAISSGGATDQAETSFEMGLIRLAYCLEERTIYGISSTG